MSRANCFVILGDEVGDLDAGAQVDVQMFEGMI